MQDEVLSRSARPLEQFDRLTTDIRSSTGIRLITDMRFASYIATLGRGRI